MFLIKNRRGQVTIFIIVAVVIVAVAVFLYLAFPSIKTNLGIQQQNPRSFIQTCVEKDIKDAVAKISIQGGSINPSAYTVYNDNKVEYLCYTNENNRNCVVQQPMLKQHIESELETNLQDEVNSCFDSLQASYEKQGYQTTLQKGQFNFELLPKRVVANMNYSFTLTKTNTETYKSFSVVIDNNLYELIGIANSIIQWLAVYGNVDVMSYMTYYHDLKVQENQKSDGSKIYVITDRNTKNQFEFAARSLVWGAI